MYYVNLLEIFKWKILKIFECLVTRVGGSGKVGIILVLIRVFREFPAPTLLLCYLFLTYKQIPDNVQLTFVRLMLDIICIFEQLNGPRINWQPKINFWYWREDFRFWLRKEGLRFILIYFISLSANIVLWYRKSLDIRTDQDRKIIGFPFWFGPASKVRTKSYQSFVELFFHVYLL